MIPKKSAMQQVLEFAEDTCSCESYYRYTCSKCRKSSDFSNEEDIAKAIKLAKDREYVFYHHYHGLYLTDDGKEFLKQLTLDLE